MNDYEIIIIGGGIQGVFLRADDQGDRYLVRYSRQGEESEMRCRVLINAGGPWAAKLQELIGGAPAAPPIELTGRISDAIFYLESPIDRRAMFIMPWHQNTLVGTTDDPAASKASSEEIDYLLAAVRKHFPSFKSRVTDSFAGLRVLPKLQTGLFNQTQLDDGPIRQPSAAPTGQPLWR